MTDPVMPHMEVGLAPETSLASRLLASRSFATGAIITAVIVAMALVSFGWTPYDVTKIVIADRLKSPSLSHWFGTDHFGRDIFSMIMVGARNSIAVALVAVGIGLAAGVPLPRVVRDVSGNVLADVGGHQVRVHDWMDVGAADRSLDPGEVGRVVALVHRVRVPVAEPIHPWYTTPVGLDAWQHLAERLTAAGAPFAVELTALVPNLHALESLIGPRSSEQWCHSDLWSDNVLPRLPVGSGVAVLDWENAGPGVPVQELALVLYDFGQGDHARARALHAAYAAAGGPARVTGPDDFAVLAAQLGHIVEMGCEGWLTADTESGRAHHEAWVREYLDDPLTESRIDGIVAAVRPRVRTPRAP